MKAYLILEGELPADGRRPLVAEVVEVATSGGRKLEVAGLAVASRHVASQYLGREPEGHPVFLYTTSEPIGGSA